MHVMYSIAGVYVHVHVRMTLLTINIVFVHTLDSDELLECTCKHVLSPRYMYTQTDLRHVYSAIIINTSPF